MNKKVFRIITVLLTIAMVVFIATTSFAALTVEDVGKEANVDVSKVGEVGSKIATILRAIGTVLLVVVLMVLGIKYMMGSAEEKAEYKKTMIPYLVGAILVFGATQIAGAVLNFAK